MRNACHVRAESLTSILGSAQEFIVEAERIRRETRVVDETPRKAKHPRADDDQ